MSAHSDNYGPAPVGSDETGSRQGVDASRSPGSLSERVRSLRLTERPARGSRWGWLPWVLCALLTASTAVLGYQVLNHSASPGNADSDAGRSAAPAIPADNGPVGEVVHEAKGYIIAAHQILVSPKVSGMVLELNFDEGKVVKEGDVLAELEDVDYRADYDRAVAAVAEAEQNLRELTEHRDREIEQAKARWEEAEVQRRQLYLDKERSSRLRGGALAEREYEQAESAYLAMLNRERSLRLDYELLIKGPRDNRIKAAQERLSEAKADLAKAKWRLDNCKVRAPISGTILTKKAEKGNIVNSIAFNVSASLCEIADLSDLEVDLKIQERDIARVVRDQKCRIRADAYPDRIYHGKVSRLMPIGDRSNGVIPIRVKILDVPKEEEGKYLKPEMSVLVSFEKMEKN